MSSTDLRIENVTTQSLDSWNRSEWISMARCRDGDPDALFVRGAAQRKAAEFCKECPVLLQCRADALDNRAEFGVWGGMTERQRRALLKKNPHVQSWAAFFVQSLRTHRDNLLARVRDKEY